MKTTFIAVIEREDDTYVALCPQLDIASQGDTIPEARDNLTEAVTLFFEHASQAEINETLTGETYITNIEVQVTPEEVSHD